MSNILFLSPHPDDIELGCGATIAKLIQDKHKVYVAIFSDCTKSIVSDAKIHNPILKENINSLSYLGIENNNIYYYNYEVREFSSFRQNILEDLVLLKKNINPDVIFIPCTNDKHQDHQVISNEAIRCFKNISTIYGYQLLWNLSIVYTNCIFELDEDLINKKINALKYYESQKMKSYFNEEYIKSMAKIFGLNTKHGFAESFEIIYLKNKMEI